MNIINKHTFLRDRQETQGRLERWQGIVNQIAETYGGAASLICQLTDTGIRPVVSSEQDMNPFPAGATFPLEAHTFCKEVISRNDAVYVGNAEEDPHWSPSPVWTEFGFASYYGLPLRWPDQELFGTICVLDQAPTHYEKPFLVWMSCFRDLVQADLEMTALQINREEFFEEIGRNVKSSAVDIIDRTEALMSSPVTDEQRADISQIQDCAESLVCLLNDAVGYTHLDGAQLGTDSAAGEASQVRVLVVDDNHINQKVAVALLSSLKFEVEVANDGKEALDAVQSTHFDIILMDVQMPIMDGLEATKKIRSLGGRLATVPIVAVTANAMTRDKYKCIEAGMNDLLPKPIEPDRFIEVVLGYTKQSVA